MAPKKNINKKRVPAKKTPIPLGEKTPNNEIPPNAEQATATKHKAIVILPDGVKHENEKLFYFHDGGDVITFRGYALPSTSLASMQKAVGGSIEYAPGKPTAALQKAGYKVMACNEEGRYSCADQFNADAWAFHQQNIKLFGPVILMRKME